MTFWTHIDLSLVTPTPFLSINHTTAVKFIIFPWSQLHKSCHWLSPSIMLPVHLLLLGVTKVAATFSLIVSPIHNCSSQFQIRDEVIKHYSIELVQISALGNCCTDYLCFTYFHIQVPNHDSTSPLFSLSPEPFRFAAGFFWEHLPEYDFSIW